MAAVSLANVIVPEIFGPYMQEQIWTLTTLLQSGIIVPSETLVEKMRNAGYTFEIPMYTTPDYVDANTSNVTGSAPTPLGISASQLSLVQVHRNQTWSSAVLNRVYMGDDPMAALARYVATYWALERQTTAISILTGILADNAASPTGNDTHTQNDLIVDASGDTYAKGVTTFDGEMAIEAIMNLGDAYSRLTSMAVHSRVFQRLLQNNLIDYVRDSEATADVPYYMGKRVTVLDSMPNTGGVYDTWFYGRGLLEMAELDPDNPTEVYREPLANNGGGQETLISRVRYSLAPVGYAFTGSTSVGGPSNASTSGNFAHAGSWSRRITDRKGFPFVCLKTREH